MSLRGGAAIDDNHTAPAFDFEVDRPSPEYLEKYYWGISHLDAVSWRYYLPILTEHTLRNFATSESNAVDARGKTNCSKVHWAFLNVAGASFCSRSASHSRAMASKVSPSTPKISPRGGRWHWIEKYVDEPMWTIDALITGVW